MRISDWSSDVCSSDLRKFGERCVEFRANYHAQPNDKEKNEGNHHPGQTTISKVVPTELRQYHRQQQCGGIPPHRRESRTWPFGELPSLVGLRRPGNE